MKLVKLAYLPSVNKKSLVNYIPIWWFTVKFSLVLFAPSKWFFCSTCGQSSSVCCLDTFTKVDYSPIDLYLLNNVSGHRNIKLLGHALVAFTFIIFLFIISDNCHLPFLSFFLQFFYVVNTKRAQKIVIFFYLNKLNDRLHDWKHLCNANWRQQSRKNTVSFLLFLLAIWEDLCRIQLFSQFLFIRY